MIKKLNQLPFIFISLAIFFQGIAISPAEEKMISVRDAQTEALVRSYAQPILVAAGLPGKNIEIILLKDSHFNAFVSGQRIFINTGTLLATETPNQMIGILAHEIGHLAGGHLQRMQIQMENAKKIAVTGMIIGALAGAFLTEERYEPQKKEQNLAPAGVGIAMGIGELAKRNFLHYMRSEENTADQAALTYLHKTGQSGKGLLEVLRKFESQNSLLEHSIHPYLSTHPMPAERIQNLEKKIRESVYFKNKDPIQQQRLHDMVRIKIAMYTKTKDEAKKINKKRPDPFITEYSEAVERFFLGAYTNEAFSKIESLIHKSPDNPYLHELKGDAFMKIGKADKAAKAYEKAVALKPDSALLKTSLGHALLSKQDLPSLKKAIAVLQESAAREKENFFTHTLLARAFEATGKRAHANLAMANGYDHSGNSEQAKKFALQAQSGFTKGSAGWLQAQDIINQGKTTQKKR